MAYMTNRAVYTKIRGFELINTNLNIQMDHPISICLHGLVRVFWQQNSSTFLLIMMSTFNYYMSDGIYSFDAMVKYLYPNERVRESER